MFRERYTSKEISIFGWIILPYLFGLNLIIFGTCIFSSVGSFALATLLTSAYLSFAYFIFGSVAVMIKHRFPNNSDLFRRVGLMLPVFYMMNILLVTGLYSYYNFLDLLSCEALTRRFWWAVLFGSMTSTVITFINEGMSNWQSWKVSITETEQLKNTYQKTKLLGLRGQVNPHFLFNCFNSLSSLINENEEEAERFLNEMTKVHRYMLGYDDEHMVTLEEELKFVQSYLYLTDARFGNAIQTVMNVQPVEREKFLPPLSLQIILENIIYTNAISKDTPLQITISGKVDWLSIRNTLHPKTASDANTQEEGLANLVKKYRLLNKSEVQIKETGGEREILLPLLKKEEAIV